MSVMRLIAALCALSFSAPALAQSTPVTREEFPALLRETLLKNPEIVMEAVKVLQDREQANTQAAAQKGIAANKDTLFNDPSMPSAGASIDKADITLVEFFDYHCGYCKHMVEPVARLLQEDKKFRVVFIEFPILSADSAMAARAATAANRLDKNKYFAFYTALMKHNGKYDAKSLESLSRSVGIDYEALKVEMGKKEIADILEKNRNLGQELGIHGTPALIIGDELLPGALSYEELKAAIAKARSKKK